MVSKRAVLTIEGNSRTPEVRVYFEVTFDRIPQYSGRGTLRSNPELHAQLVEHWENYRQLVRQNSRSLIYLDEEATEEGLGEEGLSEEGFVEEELKKAIETDDGETSCRIHNSEVEYARRICKADCDRSQAKLRKTFLNWLEESPDCRLFNRQARDLLRKGETFQFIIRYSDPEIERLPWHEWDLFRDRAATEPAFSPLSSQHNEPIAPAIRDRVKILVILGNSAGIDIQKDRQFFERLEREAHADITFLDEPTPEAIDDSLWERGWDIICFSGHSSSEAGEGKIYINSKGDYLSIDHLWHGLKKALSNGLRLTVFNSCDGLQIAKRVNDRSIPYAIVMREAITDSVAHTFLKHFLRSFAAGRSLQASVREARERLGFLSRKVPCPAWLPTIVQTPFAETLYWKDLYQQPDETSTASHFQTEERSKDEAVASDTKVRSLTKKIPPLKVALPALALLAACAIPTSSFLTVVGESLSEGFFDTELSPSAQVFSRGLFRIATILNPWNPNAHMQLGNAHEDIDDIDAAIRYLDRAHELGSGLACSNLGRIYIRQDELEKAKARLNTCHHSLVDSDIHGMRRYHKNQGWLMYELGDLAQAEKHLQASLRREQEYGDASCLMAKVLESRDRIQQARKHWSNCLADTKDYLTEVREWRREARQALSESTN